MIAVTLPHDQDQGENQPNLVEVLHTFSALGLLHGNNQFFQEFPANNHQTMKFQQDRQN